jgi:hypothetical protein
VQRTQQSLRRAVRIQNPVARFLLQQTGERFGGGARCATWFSFGRERERTADIIGPCSSAFAKPGEHLVTLLASQRFDCLRGAR